MNRKCKLLAMILSEKMNVKIATICAINKAKIWVMNCYMQQPFPDLEP